MTVFALVLNAFSARQFLPARRSKRGLC